MKSSIFGITGGSGAGKSTISKIFRAKGVYVADADMAARQVVKKGMSCFDELKAAFGDMILTDAGELDRRRLADIVFNDTEKLATLNRITHKYIKAYLENEITAADTELAAIDGAVIIGSPVMDICSCLVVVVADDDARILRIMERDGIDKAAARARIDSQLPQTEYVKYADYVIENNNSSNAQEEKVEEILSKIKAYSSQERSKKKEDDKGY